jgi:hypothetical protein
MQTIYTSAGGFTNSADEQYVAKWDGSRWTELGAGANGLHANGLIYALATDNAGNVYTAGHFTNSVGKYYVARLQWHQLDGVGISFSIKCQ